VTERRLTNSELRLQQLEEEEREATQAKGILEIFDRDADEPIGRERDADR
jgi:hypothetical protein